MICNGLANAASVDPSDALACVSIQNNETRLQCYDQALGVASNPVVSNTVAPAAQSENQDTAAQERDSRFAEAPVADNAPAVSGDFGAEDVTKKEKKKRPKGQQSITAKIADLSKNSAGRLTIELDNGQIWRQIRSDSGKLLLPKKPEGRAVIIRRGLLGSYVLRTNKSNRTIRVERIR